MVNGTLPNVAANSLAANYLAKNMANLTLQSYNSSVRSLLNLGAIAILINESKPQVFQVSPYTLSVTYLQNVALNSSSGRFTYQIPVNATIALNGTPDLYSYELGIPINVKFASISNLTNIISGLTSAGDNAPINATNGNFLGSIYGPVYTVPGGVTCATLPSNLPGAFTYAPYNQFLIIATTNAIGITNGGSGPTCLNQYGGLITYSVNSLSNPPAIPWLIYPSTSNYLNNIKSGQQVLIHGNYLSVLNIQSLINSVGGGSYFASPFTPSYLDRAQSIFTTQNPNGEFTLSSYNTQAANFNSITGWVNSITTNANQINTNAGGYNTVSFWMLYRGWRTPSGEMPIEFTAASYDLYFQSATCFGFNTQNSDAWGLNPTNMINKWTFVVAKFYNGFSSNSLISINGNNMTLSQCAGSQHSATASSPLRIGNAAGFAYSFNGEIANVQLYNTSLSQSSIQTLYQRGITGAPLNSPNLAGWWPLNGNPNDLSGNSNNGILSTGNSLPFTVLENYSNDAIFSYQIPSTTSALQGILGCKTNANCTSTLQPKLSLGYLPLQVQQLFLQTGSFNGLMTSNIVMGTTGFPTGSAARTMVAWVDIPFYGSSGCGLEMATGYGPSSTCNGNFAGLGLSAGGNVGFAACGNDYTSSLNAPLNSWTFIAAVYASGSTQVTMYLNTQSATGALSAGNVLNTPSSSISSNIGKWPTGCYFNGKISNVQIYANALSTNQITSLYTEGLQGLPLQTNGLVGWWPLNGNANDYSGNSDNGFSSNIIYSTFFSSSFNTYNGVTGYFSFNPYNGPGMSAISGTSNEWQALGIPKSG